jgi:hypothetical protein
MTSTEQLELEAEQTRARLANTLEELRGMTPGRVLDEVLDYAKDGGGDLLRGMGHQISENPVPAALIGAGLAWMMMGNKSGNGRARENTGPSASGGMSSAADSASQKANAFGSSAASAAQGTMQSLQGAANTVSGTASSLMDKTAGAYEAVAEMAGRTTSSMKAAAGNLTDTAVAVEQITMAATRGLFDFCKDQPLVLAGLGLAIGATLGAAIPESQAEDRLMGETADQVKDKAQRLASEQMQTAKAVGQHVVDETAKLAKEELTSVLGEIENTEQQQSQTASDQTGGGTANTAPLSGQPDLQIDEDQSRANPSGSGNPRDGQFQPIH